MIKNIFLIVLSVALAGVAVVAVLKHNKLKKLQDANKDLAGRLADFEIDHPDDTEPDATT